MNHVINEEEKHEYGLGLEQGSPIVAELKECPKITSAHSKSPTNRHILKLFIIIHRNGNGPLKKKLITLKGFKSQHLTLVGSAES